jgi:hypothetical protein
MNDLTDKRFGKLIVKKFDGIRGTKSGIKKYYWECLCDCGNKTVVNRAHLKSGGIRSCGCLATVRGKNARGFRGCEEISGKYFGSLKRNATYKNRHFKFLVSIEDLWKLFIKQNRKCALTGLDIHFAEDSRSRDRTASLDRIDSKKDYIISNVQWVHKDVNLMKKDYDQSRFLEICRKVAFHTIQNQEVFPS